MAIIRQRFSRPTIVQRGRRMKLDDDLDGAQTHHAPYVGCKLDRSVPSEERTVEPPDRYAVEPCVGDRDWLHSYPGTPVPRLSGAEQGGFERQHAIAIAARPFREEDQSIT